VSKTKLNKIIWADPSALYITDKQLPAFKRLKQILQKSKLPAAKLLCEGEDAKWTPQGFSDIEAEINTKTSTMLYSETECSSEVDSQEHLADELKNISDCLAKVVDRIVSKVGYEAPRPRYVSRIRLETNPFKDDLSDAERTFRVLKRVVSKGQDTRPNEPHNMIALALLSAIAQFQLLHMDLQVAWFEALADRSNNILTFKNQVECIELQVQWGNQPNAERRLYIPDRNTRRLITQIKATDLTDILEGIRENHHQSPSRSNTAKKTSRNRASIYKFLQRTVDEYIAARSVRDVRVRLPDATRAARTLVYLHVPAAVAAYRKRTTISHAPRMAVLRRISSGVPVTGGTTPPIILKDSEEALQPIDVANKESSELKPQWYIEMRRAFECGKKPEAGARLARIGDRYGSMGLRMAEFAQHLLKRHEISTASRFSLLIGRRLGCRQEIQTEFDPTDLGVSELESLYEEILEEDWDDVTPETQEEEIRRDKRMTVLAILKFHEFLDAVYKVGKLDELKDRLTPNGLLPVDANFITIDEYRRVLSYIDRDTNLNDPYMRKALQLFISLCFWGGLRRDEALGLRVSDLDAAGHLHIRPYAKRKLKTSNANRSLPVATLLPNELFKELVQWAKERADASRSSEIALFFSRRDDASMFLSPKAVYSKIITSMRGSLGDQSLKIHHLRHSFATLLAAKLLSHMQTFPSRLFARHPETLEWLADREAFRSKLFLTDQMRGADLQGIAHLLGHGSPGTSVEHYCHCFDWCLPNRMDATRRNNR
jgi:integrase